jgi:hypothetical protein
MLQFGGPAVNNTNPQIQAGLRVEAEAPQAGVHKVRTGWEMKAGVL